MIKVYIPQEINIGKHKYSICFNPHLQIDERDYGQINHRSGKITITPEKPPPMLISTLIHEIIHIAEFYYRVDISDPDIDRISEVIMQFLFELGIEFVWEIPTES